MYCLFLLHSRNWVITKPHHMFGLCCLISAFVLMLALITLFWLSLTYDCHYCFIWPPMPYHGSYHLGWISPHRAIIMALIVLFSTITTLLWLMSLYSLLWSHFDRLSWLLSCYYWLSSCYYWLLSLMILLSGFYVSDASTQSQNSVSCYHFHVRIWDYYCHFLLWSKVIYHRPIRLELCNLVTCS